MNNQRQEYDPRLDRLYMKSLKCPYCGYKIKPMRTVCEQCGLTKMMIANASNKEAKRIIKEKEDSKIVVIKRRPDDVKMSNMILNLLIGFTGAHCFHVGRKIRGFIIASLMLLGIASFIIFPMGDMNEGFAGIHPWREATMGAGWPFPLDFLVVVALIMWWMDIFAVLIGYFKYPVRLGEHHKKLENTEHKK